LGTNIILEDTGGENTTNGANRLSQHFFKRQTNSSMTLKEEDQGVPVRGQELNGDVHHNSND
jgi:hypothetical protein